MERAGAGGHPEGRSGGGQPNGPAGTHGRERPAGSQRHQMRARGASSWTGDCHKHVDITTAQPGGA